MSVPANRILSQPAAISRREMLAQMGSGFGAISLAALLADESLRAGTVDPATQITPSAKRVIFLVMNGGPSQVDTFDPKPMLEKLAGQRPPESLFPKGRSSGTLMPSPFKFTRCGQSGI